MTPAMLQYTLDGQLQSIPLDRGEMVIGRAPTCDISLDIVHLSRQHARLFFQDDSWWIEDLQSRNGVFVNGLKIDRQRLQDGDSIRLGDSKFWFVGRQDAVSGESCAEMPTMGGAPAPRPSTPKTVAFIPPPAPVASPAVSESPRTSTGRGIIDPLDLTPRDPVDCTVFAPPRVNAAEQFMVQVFVHMPEEADAAALDAIQFDEDATRRGTTSLGATIERGATLSFELRMPHASIDEPIRDIVWRGRRTSVQFGVNIPHTHPGENVLGTVIIAQNSAPIGSITFKVKVAPPGWHAPQEAEPTGQSRRYTQAFISYASRDRSEVIRRVQMLKNVGISFFQDVLSLEPGERWAQRLYERIDQADVLFLFWSTAAKESEWVAKEWQYALERKGDDFIRPVGIEGPPIPEPPEALKHLHFGDPLLYFIQATQAT